MVPLELTPTLPFSSFATNFSMHEPPFTQTHGVDLRERERERGADIETEEKVPWRSGVL